MQAKNFSKWLLLSSVAAVTVSNDVHADTQLRDEIVISASRTPLDADKVGSAFTVLSGAELDHQQIRVLSDALRSVPSLAVSRSGSVGGLSQIRIRGAEANQALVVLDGIELNDPAFGSEYDFGALLAHEIERVEVLRGPQSALWGSDALAGVVNFVTKQGQEGLQLQAFGEGGSFATAQLGGAVRGAGDGYNFALSTAFLRTDGINTSVMGSEKDGYRNATGAAKANFELTDSLSLGLVGRYTTGRSEFDDAGSGPPVDADLESKNRQAYGRVFLDFNLFDDLWTNRASFTIADTSGINYQDGLRIADGTEGQRLKYDFLSSVNFQTDVGTVLDHRATLLLERETEKFTQTGTAFTSFGTFFDPNQNQKESSNSIAGEYHLGLGDLAYLTAAVRFDDNDRFENQTTYRGTASVRVPVIDVRLHGSYGTGAKDPSFTELFGFFSNQFIGNPNLRTETSRGWDIGGEKEFFDGRAVVDVTYFNATLKNEISTIFPPPAFIATPVNDTDTSRREGIEVAVQANPLDIWALRFSYSHLRATESGATEIRRPETLLSFQSDLSFAEGRGNLNLSLDYNSDQLDDDFSTFPATRLVLDSFVLLDIAGSYRVTDNVTMFGRVENVLDADYQEVFGFETRGIGAFGGIKVDFDWQT